MKKFLLLALVFASQQIIAMQKSSSDESDDGFQIVRCESGNFDDSVKKSEKFSVSIQDDYFQPQKDDRQKVVEQESDESDDDFLVLRFEKEKKEEKKEIDQEQQHQDFDWAEDCFRKEEKEIGQKQQHQEFDCNYDFGSVSPTVFDQKGADFNGELLTQNFLKMLAKKDDLKDVYSFMEKADRMYLILKYVTKSYRAEDALVSALTKQPTVLKDFLLWMAKHQLLENIGIQLGKRLAEVLQLLQAENAQE